MTNGGHGRGHPTSPRAGPGPSGAEPTSRSGSAPGPTAMPHRRASISTVPGPRRPMSRGGPSLALHRAADALERRAARCRSSRRPRCRARRQRSVWDRPGRGASGTEVPEPVSPGSRSRVAGRDTRPGVTVGQTYRTLTPQGNSPWSPRWESNPRPTPYQGVALPLSHLGRATEPGGDGTRCRSRIRSAAS